MNREYDPDPEVLADLALRKSSQYDRSRSGEANYAWSKPVPVASWPCRVCKKPCAVTEEATDALATWNAILARRGELPLDTAKIAVCDSCRAMAFEARGDRNAERVAIMRDLIRKLKASDSPVDERDIVAKLTAMNHPDVEGLLQAIRDRRVREQASKGRKSKEI